MVEKRTQIFLKVCLKKKIFVKFKKATKNPRGTDLV